MIIRKYQIIIENTKWPKNIPNDCEKNLKMFHSKAFQNIPKLVFWYANTPSGSPALQQI
jgi:hypothetical protein